MNFEKFNKGEKKFNFQLPKDSTYKKLADLDVGNVYQVMGIFINRSKSQDYDDHPVAVGRHFYIDLPSYATDTAKDMINDPETVQAINDGTCGLEVTEYTIDKGRKAGTYHGFKWVNFDTETQN